MVVEVLALNTLFALHNVQLNCSFSRATINVNFFLIQETSKHFFVFFNSPSFTITLEMTKKLWFLKVYQKRNLWHKCEVAGLQFQSSPDFLWTTVSTYLCVKPMARFRTNAKCEYIKPEGFESNLLRSGFSNLFGYFAPIQFSPLPPQ